MRATRASGPVTDPALQPLLWLMSREQGRAIKAICDFCALAQGADGEQQRAIVTAMYEGQHVPEHYQSLLIPIARYSLKKSDFMAVLDGMEMDAPTPMVRPDLRQIDLYCDRSTSAILRLYFNILQIPIFEAMEIAYHLGRAIKMTDILNHLLQDAAQGRMYLPDEFLASAGIPAFSIETILGAVHFSKACQLSTEWAWHHFRETQKILDRGRRKQLHAPKILKNIYVHVLSGIQNRAWTSHAEPIQLSVSRVIIELLRVKIFD